VGDVVWGSGGWKGEVFFEPVEGEEHRLSLVYN
jgi:hypothetical protein